MNYRYDTHKQYKTKRMFKRLYTDPVYGRDVVFATTAWRRHQMETFSALIDLYAGNSLVTGELPSERPVARNFNVFFDLSLNKRLSKQSWGW